MRFSKRLNQSILSRSTPVCVGIDPAPERMPDFFRLRYASSKRMGIDAFEFLNAFARLVIDSVQEHVAIVKPQAAYFERFGSEGMRALESVVSYAKDRGLIVILDAKRGDISDTSAAYAKAYLSKDGPFEGKIDCITLNPYLGLDSITPFAEVAEQNESGLFVCVRTSNPGATAFQNLEVQGRPIYSYIADIVLKLNRDVADGYGDVGAVVGATCNEEAQEIRKLLPESVFLVPGVGAQGGSLDVVSRCFNKEGLGAVVNSSRAITYPEGDFMDEAAWSEAITASTLKLKADVASCLNK